jgi:hypothetical protein
VFRDQPDVLFKGMPAGSVDFAAGCSKIRSGRGFKSPGLMTQGYGCARA